MSIFIKNGRLLISTPAGCRWETGNIRLEDSRIADLGPDIPPHPDDEIIDATGKFVAPGLVDPHVHLREPGREDEETIESGTRAAAAGGFTAIACMPNTEPPLDSGAVIQAVQKRARAVSKVRVFPVGCITKGRQGKQLAEMGEMVEAGARGFSDDGSPVADSEIMRRALEYSRPLGVPIISHAEDPRLAAGGVMHEGFMATVLGLPGIPAAAESVMVARDVLLAQATKGRLHIAHVSTRESVEIIAAAKAKGVAVTAEVTPHHLLLSDEAVRDFDTNTKVNPPLRSNEHIEALRTALVEGTIDCIATDHAPHSREEKDCDYLQAAFGLTGLETAFPLLFTHLVEPGILDLATLLQRMSLQPAQLLGLADHGLKPGNRADVVVIDPKLEKTFDPEEGYSKSHNTPFAGQTLRGWPVLTVAGGHVVYRDKSI